MENLTFQKAIPQITDSKEIPLWQKYTLIVEEAVSEDYIRRNYAHGCTKELGIYNNKRGCTYTGTAGRVFGFHQGK